MISTGVGEPEELDAFFDGVLQFLDAGGRFAARAAVDAR